LTATRLLSCFVALAALLVVATASPRAHAADCSEVRNGLRSLDGSVPATLTFINASQFTIRLEWADYGGELKEYATVEPGQSHRQPTYISHPWVATTMPGDCLAVYLPRPGESQVVMNFAPIDDGEESDGGTRPPAGGAAQQLGVEGRSFGGIVRAGPGMEFAKVASLPEGAALLIEEDTGVDMGGYHWFRIRFGNRSGYQWGGILCARSEIAFALEICR
jgi:hypothetical protein